MTLLEILRNQTFWMMDRLKGGLVFQGLNILERIEGGRLTEEEVAVYQQEQIEKLLRHCRQTVPAYKDIKDIDLKAWPIVNKAILKEGGVAYHSIIFNKNDLFTMATSGSTGTPFISYQDLGKKKHVNAEVLFYNGKIDYKIGKRIIYFRSVVNEVAKSPLQQFMQNIYLLDCQDLSDSGIVQKLRKIKKLSTGCGAMILSYSSTLDAFRKYFDKYGLKEAEGCNIYGIVAGSEMLHDVTRIAMEKAFNCKCVSRYANEENGFIGQDSVQPNIFIHNRANYFIEILKLTVDEPAAIGETGRVIITDLYNYAMPMVRYDTGYVAAWYEVVENGVKRKAIGSFGGRIVDMIFDCNGNLVSPHSITNKMWKVQNIKQFQFIQKTKTSFLMRINTENSIDEVSLLNVLHSIVGENAEIKIEYCHEIPVLASGKRRYIVNEMR